MKLQKPLIAMLLGLLLHLVGVSDASAGVASIPGYSPENNVLDVAEAESGQNLAFITRYVEDTSGDLVIGDEESLGWKAA
ncbi:MAG: hypothetical protein VX245_07505, partial [Pseudomonadota bacterium]|nr:hypothetical protein [Pseudomonadota bacterium]